MLRKLDILGFMFENENQRQHQPSLFLLQQLPTHRFEITSRIYIFVFNILSLVFAAVGLFLVFSSENPTKYSIEYSKICENQSICTVHLNLTKNLPLPIAILYEIKGLYQNHLYSMRSRNDDQLLGEYVRFEDMANCKPFRSINDDPSPNKWILPCGLEAVTFFNDTFDIKGLRPLNGPLFSEAGIYPHTLNVMYQTGVKWLESKDEYFTDHLSLRFYSWMETAAFMPFRKVYGITSEKSFSLNTSVQIEIQNNFNVGLFGGSKYLILSTRGSRSSYPSFLGYFYIATAGLMLISTTIAVIVTRNQKLPL